jgi:hypothetical protein
MNRKKRKYRVKFHLADSQVIVTVSATTAHRAIGKARTFLMRAKTTVEEAGDA